MTDKDPLGPFFAAARAERPEPSDALIARVLVDAEAESVAPLRMPKPVAAGRLWRLKEALGGWPGLAGLTATAAAGIWIGVVLPDLGAWVLPGAAAEAGFDLTDLLPGYGAGAFEEG